MYKYPFPKSKENEKKMNEGRSYNIVYCSTFQNAIMNIHIDTHSNKLQG